ncbi:MAG TPA: glycosyltransferase [Isosphaeraceae bacterium]|jgi:glycosyltransferase involved in cell wall biosynthesis|nr:glycosyltransferase [Isosphaeraceae bacterium]
MGTMIRIMHVVDLPCSNPWLNGIAVHHDRSHFQHTVVSIGARNGMHEALERLGVRCFALEVASRSRWPFAIARLSKLLRDERIDLVQTHLFDPSVIGLIAARLAGTPYKVVTRHHSDFTTLFHRPIHCQIDRWQALTADRVMAASDAVRRAMMQFERVPAERIEIGRYGYDFEALRPCLSPERRKDLRESLGGGGNYLIGTVARLSIEKGHEYLLRAVPTILRLYPDSRFVLVGTGPLRAELERIVDAIDARARVQFTGWRADAQHLIEAMDLVVHPTLHEAFCSVIIEAMALERPLIATDVAAAREQIDHGETGLIVPERDPKAIVEAVRELRNDKDRAVQMGREARRRVVERFNFPRMMREYESFYDRVLNSKTAS